MSDVPKAAEPLPPTALSADVYLDKLERLLHENARLQSSLGQCLGVLRGVKATDSNMDSDWVESAVDPVIDLLTDLLK